MQHIDTSHERMPNISDVSSESIAARPGYGFFHWRFLIVYLILLGLVLLAVVPPLVNVSRFKRRIVTSISASIGRPVHLDNVSLVLLPFPGFKLENFVVAEDPAFGAEPVIHANNVVATLRFSSLWRRRVEFSRISLQEPSINLVHMPGGEWNVESILLQASRISAAPTAQAKAGADPRFPYIEATGARVNIKYGNEKLPFSLTEADFSLWLPRPQQWRIRLEAKPTRTDLSASDTGTVSFEGTLNSAERFDLIPIEVSGEWKNVPLGEASRAVIGRDAGLRGELRFNVSAKGTIGSSIVKSTLQLRGARRAEFVPPQSLDLRVECQATAKESFHALHEIRCSWPPPAQPSTLALTADLPDIHHPAEASFEVGTPGIPAATLLDWLRIASPRVSPDVIATGKLSGSVTRESSSVYSGNLALTSASLAGGPIGDSPIPIGDFTIGSAADEDPPLLRSQRSRKPPHAQSTPQHLPDGFNMSSASIALGGKEPAALDGHFDISGYSLHLVGNVMDSRLLALASAIPQFGDGLAIMLPRPPAILAREAPIHVDLTATRMWGGGQSWSKTPTKTARPTVNGRL